MNKQDIIIIGAGGQCKNTSLVIEQTQKFNILGFADDDLQKSGQVIRGYQVLGDINTILQNHNNIALAFSIGSPNAIEKIANKIKNYAKEHNKSFSFPNIIHPSAQIDFNEVTFGEGNVIFPNVIFFAEIKIGNFNFFNRCCSVSHEINIANYCFIHAGVHLSGEITLEDKVWVGVGSTVVQGKTIHANATIGAGAVVVKDVEANAIVVGNPAKLLRYKE